MVRATQTRAIVKLAPERALPVYNVDEPACVPADRVVVAVSAPPLGPGDIEALLRRLLPIAPVQTPPPRPIPTEMEILLERLLSGAPAPTPTPPPQTGFTGMETLLQRPVLASRSRLVPGKGGQPPISVVNFDPRTRCLCSMYTTHRLLG